MSAEKNATFMCSPSVGTELMRVEEPCKEIQQKEQEEVITEVFDDVQDQPSLRN